jgi:cell division protein ZapE
MASPGSAADHSASAGASLRERFTQEAASRGYAPDAAQSAVLARLEALRARLLSRERHGPLRRWLQRRLGRDGLGEAAPRGLYLHGSVGGGKTTLMDLFFDSLPPGMGQRRHFHHFMRDVHARLRRLRHRRAPLEALARALAAHAQVLCLDELLVGDIADAMILGTLFEALLRHGVWLVITSNLAPQGLYAGGLQRARFLPAIALLERELELCALEGGVDYRLRQLQRAPIYLDSGAPDAGGRLERLFDELAGTHGQNRTELRVLGRVLRAVRCRADVAWFDFVTLCEGSRSANDYAEIAQEFRTVLLSAVPVFGTPEQEDAARRFIALIDVFYDQGTKLVVSAAAPPAALYRGGRLEGHFRRTASRLEEMQTVDYLARARRPRDGA